MEHIFDFIYDNFFVVIYIIAIGVLVSMFNKQNNIENDMLLNNTNIDTYLVVKDGETFREVQDYTKGSDVLSFVLNSKSNNVYVNGTKWTYKDEYTLTDTRKISVNKNYTRENFVLQSGESAVYYNVIE